MNNYYISTIGIPFIIQKDGTLIKTYKTHIPNRTF
jgi:hypothetical protein